MFRIIDAHILLIFEIMSPASHLLQGLLLQSEAFQVAQPSIFVISQPTMGETLFPGSFFQDVLH